VSNTTESSIIPWVLAAIGAVVSALLTGVVKLFQLRENENAKAIAKLEEKVAVVETKADKCEEERGELRTTCALLEREIKLLQDVITKIDVDGTQYSHRQSQ
jgi:septal ring factor EnvC (AmiA/AmiB activator)